MTRYDVLKQYETTDGVIKTSGPFQGQALYVPYFWCRYLAGHANEVGDDVVQFTVHGDDRTQFPELGSRGIIRLRYKEFKIEEA